MPLCHRQLEGDIRRAKAEDRLGTAGAAHGLSDATADR
jgi:hypothetical protein